MNLSEHFTLEELTASDTARRLSIDNTPSPEIVGELRRTAELLERVRDILKGPITVTSGYRCLALNTAIGSLPSSAHVRGMAADFRCPDFGTPLDVCRFLSEYADQLDYDQLIHEFSAWVHIGRADSPRHQTLTIDGRGARPGIEA